jgi:hypothetical protein
MTEEQPKFTKLMNAAFMNLQNDISVSNPWTWDQVDKLEIVDVDQYRKTIYACRFFYKRDPIASTVINKMVDIGITGLEFERAGLTNNEENLIEGLLPSLLEFAEAMAMEYLISGLVIPEVKFTTVSKEELDSAGIMLKKFSSITLPTSMWVRDPATVYIKSPGLSDKQSYFIKIPEELIHFIQTKGVYDNFMEDKELYKYLQTAYPKFIAAVLSNKIYFKLEDPKVIRRKIVADSPYPIPYLYASIEAMKHKRNIRRMDYSIASRVISAIQIVKLGNDLYPLTEDDEEQLTDIKNQMYWRNTGGQDVERIFQLFSNHTLEIEWVFPNTEALLDDTKYKEVNRDIFYGLGFPAILVTGETERTGASDAEYAMLSPTQTMEAYRRKIIQVLNDVVKDTLKMNKMKGTTEVRFKPINLSSFRYFVDAIIKLYETGNISKETFVSQFGMSYADEFERREDEKKKMDDSDLEEFPEQPFSNPAGQSQPKPAVKPKPKPKATE